MATTNPSILERLIQARTPKTKKVPAPIAKQSEKKKQQVKEEKAAGVNDDLKAWFDYHMAHATPICSECGMEAHWLKEPHNFAIWKACQAHILPKKKGAFPSMRANLDNHIVLFPSFGGTLCGCHGFYDSSWYNASTMKIWEQVKVVFTGKLYRLIPDNEKKYIPDVLLKLVTE